MKSLLLFLLFYFQYEQLVAQDKKPDVLSKKIFISKFKRGLDIYRGGQYNMKKDLYSKPASKRLRNITVKENPLKYQRFSADGPVLDENNPNFELLQRISIPESPYFSVDMNPDKLKPKKMLSDSAGAIIRHRRSLSIPERTRHKSKKRENRKKRRVVKVNGRHHDNKNRKRSRTKGDLTKLRKGGKKKSQRLGSRNKRKPVFKELPSRRLIAARDANIEDYPYVVSIQKDDEHWCAGALLNPRLVISTANCFWKSRRISRMMIRAGSRYSDKGGQLAKIQEVVKDPRWSTRKIPDHDTALILLDRDLRFSNSLHAVDLPNREMNPPFDDVWVTSYGSERRDGMFEPRATALQFYHGRVMDSELCNNITRRFGVMVSENFICIKQQNKRAPCTRDTGAPAVSDGVLWGLASWSIRKLCGTERYPAMYSYTASHDNIDFIMNATAYLMSDRKGKGDANIITNEFLDRGVKISLGT